MKLLTIGHSNATIGGFIEALQRAEVDVLVDVRSKPRSRIAHFDQAPLQQAVEGAGIRYRFLGDRLGGVPQDPAVRARWQQGRLDDVIVAHLRETDEWHDGLGELARLLRAAGGQRVCIMCSEADPGGCHRKAIALDCVNLIEGLDLQHLSVSRDIRQEVGVQEVML